MFCALEPIGGTGSVAQRASLTGVRAASCRIFAEAAYLRALLEKAEEDLVEAAR
jgi:hypothetical protein